MNEQDQQTLGTALRRAVDAQPVRETPFDDSRLAAAREHPRGAGFPIFRYAAFAAVFVLALGAIYLSQLRPQVGPAATPSPSGSAPVVLPTAGPAGSPVGTPLPGRLNHSVAYCARVDAPPVAIGVLGVTGANAEQRITQRLQALEQLRPSGRTEDSPCPGGFDSFARLRSVRVQGETAIVDYLVAANGGWGDRAIPCATCSVIQQIVYTASEEPGVRSVVVTADGKPAIVRLRPGADPATWRTVTPTSDPLTREEVLGYHIAAATSGTFGGGIDRSVSANTRWSTDDLAPGLSRFVVELSGIAIAEPQVDVQASVNDESARPELGKRILRVTVHGISIPEGSTILNRTPLRSVFVSHEPGSPNTVHFDLGLDDLRPWRVALLGNPARVVVDIGGQTSRVTTNLAVYSVVGIDNSGRTVNITGAARAFEAQVSWRVKDGSGREIATGATTASIGTSAYWGLFDTTAKLPGTFSGDAMLEVFLTSARDGSITDLVAVPIKVS